VPAHVQQAVEEAKPKPKKRSKFKEQLLFSIDLSDSIARGKIYEDPVQELKEFPEEEQIREVKQSIP